MAEPDNDRLVIAWVKPYGYQRPIPVLARYYSEPWEQPGGDVEIGLGVEYDDESDTYICPAGWYEERAEYGDDCAPCCRIPDADVLGWCEVPQRGRRDERMAFAARYRGGPIAMASVRETESEAWRHVGAEVVMRRAGWDVVPVVVTVEEVDDGR